MAKKKDKYNAVKQSLMIDAVVDAQMILPKNKRDKGVLAASLETLAEGMETWPEAVKRMTKKKAAPKPKEG